MAASNNSTAVIDGCKRPITAPPGSTSSGKAVIKLGITVSPARIDAKSRGLAVFVLTRLISRSRSDTLLNRS